MGTDAPTDAPADAGDRERRAGHAIAVCVPKNCQTELDAFCAAEHAHRSRRAGHAVALESCIEDNGCGEGHDEDDSADDDSAMTVAASAAAAFTGIVLAL